MQFHRARTAGLRPVGIALVALLVATVPSTIRAEAAGSGQPGRRTPIVITEQATNRVMVMDPLRDWRSPAAQLWSWKPGPESEINAPESAWKHPDDARLRTDQRTGRQYVMVADSFGLLAQVPYPDAGKVAWSVNGTFDDGPHGIELLPDGNVAAAGAKGNWIRVYTASQGSSSDNYAEARLDQAHQVYWDKDRNVLWAVGGDELASFVIGGTPADPTISRDTTYRLPIDGAHDLQPVSGNNDRLWVTTVYGVFQFVKSTGKFDLRYPRYRELYASNVKSIGTDKESGTVLETVVQPGNPCSYCTDSVDLYIGNDQTRRLTYPDGQIYRARWFDEDST